MRNPLRTRLTKIPINVRRRQLDYIEQFTTDIRYIKGLDNNVADALSRIEAIGKPVDHRTLAAAQETDN